MTKTEHFKQHQRQTFKTLLSRRRPRDQNKTGIRVTEKGSSKILSLTHKDFARPVYLRHELQGSVRSIWFHVLGVCIGPI